MNMYIFGASGFSREVADICLEVGYRKITFIDNKINKGSYFGFDVIKEQDLSKIDISNAHFSIGIGEPAIRKSIFDKFPDYHYPNIYHPSASFGYQMKESVNKSIGNIITAGVRMTNNILLGDFGLYNLNVTIGHDCIIKSFVTISPGANISGNVMIETGAYIGTGATILQGSSVENKLNIKENSVVGAGAVVVRDVPANTVVKGIPAI